MKKMTKEDLKEERAKKLWNNICVYRTDSAKKISKQYEYNSNSILKVLQTFKSLGSYSGHQKGGYGSNTNPSAMKVLDSAIEHLKNRPNEEEEEDVYQFKL